MKKYLLTLMLFCFAAQVFGQVPGGVIKTALTGGKSIEVITKGASKMPGLIPGKAPVQIPYRLPAETKVPFKASSTAEVIKAGNKSAALFSQIAVSKLGIEINAAGLTGAQTEFAREAVNAALKDASLVFEVGPGAVLTSNGAFGTVFLARLEKQLANTPLPAEAVSALMKSAMAETVQQTFIIIKPDGVASQAEILKRLTTGTGLKVAKQEKVLPTEGLLKQHYSHIADKPFFPDVLKYMMGGYQNLTGMPLQVYVLEGKDAVGKVRALLGATNPNNAAPGTIRNIYGRVDDAGNQFNCVHASDGASAVIREAKLWGVTILPAR